MWCALLLSVYIVSDIAAENPTCRDLQPGKFYLEKHAMKYADGKMCKSNKYPYVSTSTTVQNNWQGKLD